MPRIRTIKPEFWQDEKMAPMQPLDRLVFLGLLSMADDAGRLVDNVKAIDGFMFSETQDSASQSLELLAANGRIQRYTASSGQRLIQITGWKKHQKIDKPGIYVLPPPLAPMLAGVSRESREEAATVPRSDLVPRIEEQGPRSTTPSALQPAHTRVESFVEQFPETHRDDVRCLLMRLGEKAESWMRSLEARITGPNSTPVPIDVMAEAIRQFNTNGGSNWRAFEGYVRKVLAGPPSDPPPNRNGSRGRRGGVAARSFANGVEALRDR